jgi:hypothetical protein
MVNVLIFALLAFPVAEWDALLQKYVDDHGRVEYARVKDDARLDAVVAQVAAARPEQYSNRAAKMAFYLNAYNICVWKNVVSRLPGLKNVDAVKDSFFYATRFSIGGKEMNLADLESKLIRPTFQDPRVHFALNCASAGCPELPRHAFTAEGLDGQLDRETRKFVAEARNVALDGKRLTLSHIFDWYKDDFGGAPQKVIGWINRYRAAGAQLPLDAKIEYVEYDWTLNDSALLGGR